MNEISLSRFLHFPKIAENLKREKALPDPDSYHFEVVDGKLMYIIPDGQIPAGEMEQRIARNLQNLVGQIQGKLPKKLEPYAQ